MKPNWATYQEVYDLFLNSKKIKRIWGKKSAIKAAEAISGGLFGFNFIQLVNIHTGEIIYET